MTLNMILWYADITTEVLLVYCQFRKQLDDKEKNEVKLYPMMSARILA